MLPRPVFVHLKRSSFGRPLPVTTAWCLGPASASPPKQPRPSLTTRAPGDVGLRLGLDGLLGEPRNAPQLGVDRLVLTSGDGDDERDFVGGPAPHFSSLFASQIRFIDLDVTLEFVTG